jgi:hypothetical protein
MDSFSMIRHDFGRVRMYQLTHVKGVLGFATIHCLFDSVTPVSELPIDDPMKATREVNRLLIVLAIVNAEMIRLLVRY